MESAVKIPLSQRINFRMILFAVVVLALIGTPVYIYLDSRLSGGIKNHGDYLEVDLKAMSNFPFDQINGSLDEIPSQFRALNGKRVMVEGEIWAPNSAGNELQNFELVYSIAKCCFSGPPQIQHFVQSKAVKGKVPYYSGLVRVVGTLHVDVQKAGGQVSSVYQLQVESVDPV